MDIYKDQSRSFSERAADLVSKMMLEEKISQLEHVSAAIPRLGIPYYNYWSEASHGVVGTNKTHIMDVTSFPSCLAMSHSWNKNLLRETASAISDEGRAYYNSHGDELHFWCPTINLLRDPRWGRNEESFGEDPYLAGKLAAEYIKGIQGDDECYLKAVSTPKHFALNNSECNRYSGSSDVDESTLREYYAKVFEYAVKEGKPASIMTSYNRVNGIPASASEMLLQTLLREEWGFDGFIVSDCGAVSFVYTSAAFRRNRPARGHFYAKSAEEASAMTLEAGTDMTCGHEHGLSLYSALQKGIITEATIDRALIRVFTTRFRLGLFDEPERVSFFKLGESDICGENATRLATQTALESIVLLKNESGILPLKTGKIRKLLVVGPNAIYRQLGGYSCGNFTGMVDTRYNTTPLEGISALAKERNIVVSYTKCWDLVRRENPYLVWTLPGMEMPDNLMGQAHYKSVRAAMEHKPRHDPIDEELDLDDTALLEKAKTMASEADAVVVIAGTDRSIAREEHDRTTLELPYGHDQKIIELAKINPNIAVFCVSMGPVIGSFIDAVPALAAVFYGGQAQGAAIAEVLFGAKCPSGRLSQTWYISENDLPPITHYGIRPGDTDTGKGRTYQYFTGDVKFPFGYGLSYTSFEYSEFTLSASECDANDELKITVNIKNVGLLPGAEVLQFYVTKVIEEGFYDNKPLKQLKSFEKVFLQPGEETQFKLSLKWSDVMFWNNREKRFKVEPGTYRISFAKSSAEKDIIVSEIVKVTGDYNPCLDKFSLNIHKHIMKAGESTYLYTAAVMSDSVHLDANEYTPLYTSSDNAIVKIEQSGRVIAVSPGATLISASLSIGGTTKTAEIPVVVI